MSPILVKYFCYIHIEVFTFCAYQIYHAHIAAKIVDTIKAS